MSYLPTGNIFSDFWDKVTSPDIDWDKVTSPDIDCDPDKLGERFCALYEEKGKAFAAAKTKSAEAKSSLIKWGAAAAVVAFLVFRKK